MTVKDLIKILESKNKNAHVCISDVSNTLVLRDIQLSKKLKFTDNKSGKKKDCFIIEQGDLLGFIEESE